MKLEHHVYVHFSQVDISATLARIEAALATLNLKETQQMALGQDILDKIAAQKTIIDGVVAYIQSLVGANVIPADVAAAILQHMDENSSELNAVLPPAVAPAP